MCYCLFDYFFTYELKCLNKVSVFKIICLKVLSCFLEELDFIILICGMDIVLVIGELDFIVL